MLASSSALIIGGYAVAVLRARKAGLLLGGVLGVVYALPYVVLAAEQYARLIGAMILAFTVTLLMYLTRRVDWYAAAPAAPAAPGIMDKP